MFVTQAKYDRAINQLRTAEVSFAVLMERWNNLVKKINDKGGDEFLEKATIKKNPPPQFSQVEIKQLLQFVHPDKNQGDVVALQLTQKLLEMRKR